MKKNAIAGALVAVFGALTVALGHVLGLDLDQVALLGVALGAVVGLVPDRSPTQRIAAFLAGFAIAWIGYAARAALLPDTATGRAVVVFLVIALCMVVAAATGSRLPLWATLVGTAAMVGSYEATYVAAPSQFVNNSPGAATTVLLAAAMGHLATMLLGPQIERSRADERAAAHRNDLAPAHTNQDGVNK